MLSSKAKKAMVLLGISALFFCLGTEIAFAASGIGKVADTVRGNFGAIAQLFTAGAYIAGMGFGVGAIVKFKAHKDNPTQVHLSQPIALLFVAAALLYIPSVFKSAGGTLYSSGTVAGVSGVSSF